MTGKPGTPDDDTLLLPALAAGERMGYWHLEVDGQRVALVDVETIERPLPIRARLEDGSIIVLEQDCDCITHAGPHWLRADQLWRESNQRLSGLALAREEEFRLREKLRNMRTRRIAELIYEKPGA